MYASNGLNCTLITKKQNTDDDVQDFLVCKDSLNISIMLQLPDQLMDSLMESELGMNRHNNINQRV